jgi:transglutaminase-like putative cysteine protease
VTTKKSDMSGRYGATNIDSSVYVLLVATVVLCSLPGLILGRVVQNYTSIWIGVVAALVGALSGLLSAGTRSNIVKVLVIASTGAVLSVVVAIVKPGFRLGGPFKSSIDALLHGWAHIATSPVPAFAVPRTLLPVSLVSFLAAAVAAVCVTKKRGPLMVLLAPLCGFLLAVIAAGRQPFLATLSALLFVVFAAVILSRRSLRTTSPGNQTSRPTRQNHAMNNKMLIGLGATTLGGALLLGPGLTFGRDQQPFDARDHVSPPELPASAISPLDLVASRRQDSEHTLFTIRTSKALYPQDLRLVALEQFDGATWTTTASYKRGGAVLDAVKRQTIETSSLNAEVTIVDLDGPWLPSIGDPISAAGVPVLVDPTSGSLVASRLVKKGTIYQLKSRRPEPQVEQLVLLPVGSSEEARSALSVPAGMPPLLTEMARTAIGTAQLPFQRAVELRNYLRTSFTLNNATPGGYSYGHLEKAFIYEGSATDEQFATMFATLGRVVGLPTRVVVGFTPTANSQSQDISVHGSDARVWAEVLFEEVGWMPFTATPSEDGDGSSSIGFGGQDAVELRESPPQKAASPGPAPLSPTKIPVTPIAPKTTGRNLVSVAAVALSSLTLAGLGMVFVVVFLKRRRTTQRRSGTPREAVIGAWRDVLDRLSEAGLSGTSTMTIEEVVQATEGSTEIASAALAGMYRPVNRALYSDAEITEADREQAWRACDRFVTSLNRKSSLPHRIIKAINPRPLFISDSSQTIGARP